jgi:hypothetical protein
MSDLECVLIAIVRQAEEGKMTGVHAAMALDYQ